MRDLSSTISNKFAGLIPEETDRFAGIETHTLITGAPFISGGIAFLDCKITQAVDVGHNTVFFGEVLDAGYQEDLKPLLVFKPYLRFIAKIMPVKPLTQEEKSILLSIARQALENAVKGIPLPELDLEIDV